MKTGLLTRALAIAAVAAGALSSLAHAGELRTDSSFVGIEDGESVGDVRSDGVVRFDPFAPTLGAAAEQAETEPTFRETYALPLGGDVDGDAKEDVLQVEVAFDDDGPLSSAFVGRSGSTGAELWRATLGVGVRWGGYLPGDATGDGRPDLAFTTLEDVQVHASWPPEGIVCFDCFKWALTAKTRLLLLDGATGEFRWQHARDVVWAFQEQPTPQLQAIVRNSVATSLLAAFAALDDVDGDGGRELLWTPWTSTMTQALLTENTQTAHALAYAGATGGKLWEVTLQGAGATPWNRDTTALAGAWPGPDGTGDGVPDVYTSEIVETQVATALTRKALDGRTGAQVWLQARSWESDARLLRAEYLRLADGRLVYTLTGNDFRSDVEAIDPATGEVRWGTLGREALFTLPAGDVDGDGGHDLVTLGYDRDSGLVALEGVDGGTGETLSRRTIDTTSLRWLYAPAPFLDHSGDGVVDPLVFGGKTTSTGVEEQVTITDLTDGSELWGSARNGDEPTIWLPASDFDGKGDADVAAIRLHDRFDDPAPRIELQALRGRDGHEIWQNDPYRTGAPRETIWSVYLGFMRDADGKRGEDMQVSSWNLWNSWAATEIVPQVDLVSGKSGRPYLRLLEAR